MVKIKDAMEAFDSWMACHAEYPAIVNSWQAIKFDLLMRISLEEAKVTWEKEQCVIASLRTLISDINSTPVLSREKICDRILIVIRRIETN